MEKPNPVPWYRFPCNFLRKHFVYHTYPNDRTFGQQLRDPFWWIYLLLTMIPFYGIQSFFFVYIFLCIDKSD